MILKTMLKLLSLLFVPLMFQSYLFAQMNSADQDTELMNAEFVGVEVEEVVEETPQWQIKRTSEIMTFLSEKHGDDVVVESNIFIKKPPIPIKSTVLISKDDVTITVRATGKKKGSININDFITDDLRKLINSKLKNQRVLAEIFDVKNVLDGKGKAYKQYDGGIEDVKLNIDSESMFIITTLHINEVDTLEMILLLNTVPKEILFSEGYGYALEKFEDKMAARATLLKYIGEREALNSDIFEKVLEKIYKELRGEKGNYSEEIADILSKNVVRYLEEETGSFYKSDSPLAEVVSLLPEIIGINQLTYAANYKTLKKALRAKERIKKILREFSMKGKIRG